MAILIFRAVFRDPKVDLRLLALGALLPSLVDKPLTLLFPDTFPAARTLGHTLVVAAALLVAALLATRRGRRRRAWMAVVIGVFLHLILDAMWTQADVLFWPAFGWAFPPDAGGGGWPSVLAPLTDRVSWVLEAIGLTYLVVLWRRERLGDPVVRRAFLVSGRLGG
jgi:inner membrane protein